VASVAPLATVKFPFTSPQPEASRPLAGVKPPAALQSKTPATTFNFVEVKIETKAESASVPRSIVVLSVLVSVLVAIAFSVSVPPIP
jgi:hypothetical protein